MPPKEQQQREPQREGPRLENLEPQQLQELRESINGDIQKLGEGMQALGRAANTFASTRRAVDDLGTSREGEPARLPQPHLCEGWTWVSRSTLHHWLPCLLPGSHAAHPPTRTTHRTPAWPACSSSRLAILPVCPRAGQAILLPLTSSLYVPGEIADVEKVMVDVGTGYYVEVRRGGGAWGTNRS